MSETINLFGAHPGLRPRDPKDERPVVLPFPAVRQNTARGRRKGEAPVSLTAVPVLPLVRFLCETLNDERIRYCHWKSNWKLDQWMNGVGDLDLLVDVADAQRFTATIGSLGFKQAVTENADSTPGLFHYYGWDVDAAKLVHLHVYYRLVFGNEWTANYHLPIEKQLLESACAVGLMPVPSVELELILFVIRKTLSYSALESFLRTIAGRSGESEKLASELAWLESKSNPASISGLLSSRLPAIEPAVFERCVNSLKGRSSRTAARRQLQKAMTCHALRNPFVDGVVATWRLLACILRDRLLKDSRRRHFANGGVLVALVGGDGAGKTTSVKAVKGWLSNDFMTKAFHFGKPRRSAVTIAVIIALRARKSIKNFLRSLGFDSVENNLPDFPDYLRMVRWLCAARDRRRVYLKARRFTGRGGIAICDRYVVPVIQLMDGPSIELALSGTRLNWFTRMLMNAENNLYRQIMPPDLLIVLRLDPEIAVLRKTDEREPHVRSRSREVWQIDWSKTRAQVVDASRSSESIVAELRSLIWQQL